VKTAIAGTAKPGIGKKPRGRPVPLLDILRERIASHEFPPGMKLREQQLADEFRISRAHVRDALAALAQRGLVERDPGKGAVVLRLDLNSTLSALDMRELLEGLAVRLATQRAPAGHWDDLARQFDALLPAAGSREQLAAYIHTYENFRARVIHAADNPLLTDALERLHDKTKMIMRRVLLVSNRSHAALAEHRGVVQAMQKGDAEEAERLRRKSIAAAREYLVQYRDVLF
jgi:DNA-binding GntR family transcriptional regulator